MAKKRTYVFSDGHSEQLTEKQTWDGLRVRGAFQWSRIGKFSLVLFKDENLAVCEYYDSDSIDDEEPMAKDHPVYSYFVAHMKDRLKLGRNIEMVLMRELQGAHPLAEELLAAILKERTELAEYDV